MLAPGHLFSPGVLGQLSEHGGAVKWALSGGRGQCRVQGLGPEYAVLGPQPCYVTLVSDHLPDLGFVSKMGAIREPPSGQQ